MKVSLILATLNRSKDLKVFFNSMELQDYKDFELIIVDQSENELTHNLCRDYQKRLNVIYLKSAIGLSIARNLGISEATGQIFCFPDDDCTYYPDTLANVVNYFSINPNIDIVYGRIFDKELNRPIIKKWKNRPIRINEWNFYSYTTSITIFSRDRTVKFDDELGAGSFFGSNEDTDYIYRMLRTKHSIYYDPKIMVNHPPPSFENLDSKKIIKYGMGFGRFISKNLGFSTIILFLLVMVYHKLMALAAIIKLNRILFRKSILSISSRISGLFA